MTELNITSDKPQTEVNGQNREPLEDYQTEIRRVLTLYSGCVNLLRTYAENEDRVKEYWTLMAQLEDRKGRMSSEDYANEHAELIQKEKIQIKARDVIRDQINKESYGVFVNAHATRVEVSMDHTREGVHTEDFNPKEMVKGVLAIFGTRRMRVEAFILGAGNSGDFYENLSSERKKQFVEGYKKRAREEHAKFYDDPAAPPTFFIVLRPVDKDEKEVLAMDTTVVKPLNNTPLKPLKKSALRK